MTDLQKKLQTERQETPEIISLDEERAQLERDQFIANWYQLSSSYLLQPKVIEREEEVLELEQET